MAKAKVDPDTGYTPAQQQKRWNAVFNQVQKEMEVSPKAKRKVGVRQPKSDNQLKGQAIEMLRSGKSVTEVANELGKTYANINYYKKFV
jgi:DNA-binding NarL/FixJ family response regulator